MSKLPRIMKTLHTPGPWYTLISTPKEQKEKYGSNGGAIASILHKTGKKIFGREVSDTIVYMPHWQNDSDNDEMIANAKLIAAAPELLKALQDLIEDVKGASGGSDPFTIEDANSLVEDAIAIIKKATE